MKQNMNFKEEVIQALKNIIKNFIKKNKFQSVFFHYNFLQILWKKTFLTYFAVFFSIKNNCFSYFLTKTT